MYYKKGRKTIEWEEARARLKGEYQEKGIVTCELRFDCCWYNNALGFAHRYKRADPRCRHTFEQTILACNPCHNVIEHDKELTEQMFEKLRPM